MRKQFDLTDALDRFAAKAKESGFHASQQWRDLVVEKLKSYAKTINPFNRMIKPMFGVRAGKRRGSNIFVYGINPNIKFDDSYPKPSDRRYPTEPYNVDVTPGRKIRKPGWKTLSTAQVHEKDVGAIQEFGLNNFFTFRDYIYGITSARNVESAHSTKNIAEMIFETDAIDRILQDAADEVEAWER